MSFWLWTPWHPRATLGCDGMQRVDAYIRVSRVGKRKGERFMSPDQQRDAIIAWATGRRDIELVRIFEELDESGRRPDRPLLTEAVRRIEDGYTDGLVVWRVSRFGRSLLDGLTTIERVRSVGGIFNAVADGLDTSTDAGMLVLRILLSVAQWDVEQMSAMWETARDRAVRRGVYIGSAVPVGYRKTPAGRLRANANAAVCGEVYRRRARGDSLVSLCRYLEDERVLTALGNRCWNPSSVRQLIRNRVYLGEVRSGVVVNDHAHPPLIDPVTWERAQHPNPPAFIQGSAGPALLRGLARCAGCSAPLHVTRQPPLRFYRCARVHAGGHCPAPAGVAAAKLEQYVSEAFFALVARRRATPSKALAIAERRADQAAVNLATYRDNDGIRNLVGNDSFRAGLQIRRERLREARLALGAARSRAAPHIPPAAELRRTWPELDVDAQRALLDQVIGCVFLSRALRNERALAERVTICPIGTEPRDLPRRGRLGYPTERLRPIKPQRGWMNPAPG